GLLLLQGRLAEAAYIIRGFGSVMRHGLIPNLMGGGETPRFNARDAVWWWAQAVQNYCTVLFNLVFNKDDENDDDDEDEDEQNKQKETDVKISPENKEEYEKQEKLRKLLRLKEKQYQKEERQLLYFDRTGRFPYKKNWSKNSKKSKKAKDDNKNQISSDDKELKQKQLNKKEIKKQKLLQREQNAINAVKEFLTDSFPRRFDGKDQSLQQIVKIKDVFAIDEVDWVVSSQSGKKVCLLTLLQETLAAHAAGIHFREWNAGRQIDEKMNHNGFNIDITFDYSTGFSLGGNKDNCGTWCDKMGDSERGKNRGVPATPRDGFPVEIAGLLYSTLRFMTALESWGVIGEQKQCKPNNEFTTENQKQDQNYKEKVTNDEQKKHHIFRSVIFPDGVVATDWEHIARQENSKIRQIQRNLNQQEQSQVGLLRHQSSAARL
ncbi:MAG: glycogen debranching enzyme, partial [Streblomastix strix]